MSYNVLWESRLIVCAQLERVSWAAGGISDVIYTFVDEMTSQSVMSVDREGIPGKALEKR